MQLQSRDGGIPTFCRAGKLLTAAVLTSLPTPSTLLTSGATLSRQATAAKSNAASNASSTSSRTTNSRMAPSSRSGSANNCHQMAWRQSMALRSSSKILLA